MAREMKDSGINWLPKIPKTWEIKPLKNLFNVGKGLSITKDNLEEQGIPTVSYGQIHAKYNIGTKLDDRMFRYVNESYLKTNPNALVSEGCFVFADTSEDLEGCGNCIYVDKDESFFAGYHTVTLFPKEGKENKYFAYLFKTDEWRSQIRAGLTEVKLYSVPQKVIRRTQIIIPPLKEQLCITSFLDTKCAEIDKAIDATKASIEEYKKLRQAIITEAVTKGLDPNTEMKDSGIGDGSKTPIKWKLLSLKRFVKMNSGDNLTSEEIIEEGSYPVYGGNGFRGYYHSYNCSGLHVLIGRQGALAGNIHIVDGEYWATDHAIVVYNNSKIDTQFLYYKLIGMNLNQYAYETAAQPGLAVNKIINLKSVFPISLAEQKKIADYLDTKCAQIDSLIKSKEKLIEELTAYRKSLIYEYVTGKKEVPAV